MRTLNDAPEKVKPYIWYGATVHGVNVSGEGVADCPFCGDEKHFFISTKTGQWRCVKCGIGNEEKDQGGGNLYTFLSLFWEASFNSTTDVDYQKLSEERGIGEKFLRGWGLAKSVLQNIWIAPGHNENRKLTNLYRYARLKGNKGYYNAFLGAPGCAAALFGMGSFDPSLNSVHILEGLWDGAAWTEVLSTTKDRSGRLVATRNQEDSLLAATNVLALPGCESFRDAWLPLFEDKAVTILFDNDHPKVRGDRTLEGGGPRGTRRLAKTFIGAGKPLEKVSVLWWGADGFDPETPDGFDIRDTVRREAETPDSSPLAARLTAYRRITASLSPPLPDWLKTPARAAAKSEDGTPKEALRAIECSSFNDLRMSWRKALKWRDDLDIALAVMLSVAASTKRVGDQLWLRLIGPPGCGKTRLCDAMSTSPYCYPLGQHKGFYSGWKDQDGEDYSLLARCDGKTLVAPEGDELLQSSMMNEILAQGRRIYDGQAVASYRNIKEDRSYNGLRLTWILAGTSKLRSLNRSELGERFVDCVIHKPPEDEELEILERVAYSALRSVKQESDGTPQSYMDARMSEAYSKTGGYVTWLRENIDALSQTVELAHDDMIQVVSMARLIAYMRSRPSKDDTEEVEVEMATRLSSQLVRLSVCLAVVLNKSAVDERTLHIVKKIAWDTSLGPVFSLTRNLHKYQPCSARRLAIKIRHTEPTVRKYLNFMRKADAAMMVEGKGKAILWKLTPRLVEIIAGSGLLET